MLRKANASAKTLFKTNLAPSMFYGDVVQGVGEAEANEMRIVATRVVVSAGVKPCKTAAIAIEIGARHDPANSRPTEHAKAWIATWTQASAQEKEDYIEVWQKSLPSLIAKWKEGRLDKEQSNGPISAMIATLLKQGWKPAALNRWIEEQGFLQAVVGENPADDAIILEFFAKNVEEKTWQKAAGHEAGSGLQEGVPSTEALKKAMKWF